MVEYDFATKCVKVVPPEGHKDKYGSSNVPLYQTATFKDNDLYDYTRSGNPTRGYLQSHLAKLNDCKFSFAVSTGMAALDVIFRLLNAGDEIMAGIDLYGGSDRLIKYSEAHGNLKCHFVDTRHVDNVRKFLSHPGQAKKTKLILLESPTNPQISIVDLKGIAKVARELNPDILLVVDNTMMSPYLQSPLKFGFDIVYDSATKYLSGHHDIMAGVIYGDREDLRQRIAFIINSIGNALSPADSQILLKGSRTLALRMDREQENAQAIAEFLYNLGFKTNYPGLPNYPGKEIHDAVARGYGGVLSFETGDQEMSERIVQGTSLWGISVSFGCVDSLISMPCRMSHASIPKATRIERGLPEDLIRLAVGIESKKDLIADLESAMLRAGAIRRNAATHKLERVLPDSEGSSADVSFTTSAPGKVILLAEHAVVYGVPAIAGAIDLRCFCHVTEKLHSETPSVTLELVDFNFKRTWKLNSLPWGLVTHPKGHHLPPSSIDTPLVSLLTEVGCHTDSSVIRSAVTAFLYLFMHISRPSSKAETVFVVRSDIPASAGLGSSAAYCTALSYALLLINKDVQPPVGVSSEKVIHAADKDLINAWAFVGEKIIHGNPSGVDNTVATMGGLLSFTNGCDLQSTTSKNGPPPVLPPVKTKTPTREHIPFSAEDTLRLLITDTGVKRDTKKVVDSVASLYREQYEDIASTLLKISELSDAAKSLLLKGSSLPRQELITQLGQHLSENQEQLRNLQVSHNELENIISLASQYNLASKLTGSGAGGSAITLIPDTFSDETLKELIAELEKKGFTSYVTMIGGNGIQVDI